jgi:hypothetical protein
LSAGAIRICRRHHAERNRFITVQRLEATMRADFIDLPLRQDGAEPRGEAAPAVKIPEQRPTDAVLLVEPVKIGVDAVGDFAGAAAWIQRVSSAIQHGPVFQDEMVPRGFVSGRACAGERQILEVQRAQVSFDVTRGQAGRGLDGTDFERRSEGCLGQGPAPRFGTLVSDGPDESDDPILAPLGADGFSLRVRCGGLDGCTDAPAPEDLTNHRRTHAGRRHLSLRF